ncbi:poly(A) polymerase [Rhodovulum imhoffii]|uniref:Poly(A) polymerase n=1 Tax=Rhodovulum imhoffii TaxID=365340 RepID=A0A2T5BRJ9_9RHOB|nr:CCA tRNA nucleotidyltransferase [Rhodovulum imhoffii]MBK5934012.1 CCA tRNA nucleotidyltransferase [Rhodovulum imhoffii]PTN01897.1 poly(A) polymerase [Rhodovulum imhoffii]
MRLAEDWVAAPPTQAVCAMLTGAGFRALFVGGCVRNALIGAPVSDIDIATDAPPDKVAALAETAGLRPVPTGLAHGTVTVVSGGIPHEVTTFRRDLRTDGRHAQVSFATTPEEDARRRDFTMNALYATPDGEVFDPLGGLADLRARRVRFIGAAADRIREDYLRILRFFRFHAWYGDAGAGLDREGLSACAALAGGIADLSRERLGAEMKKLLSAPDPAPSVAAMTQAGVLMRILPGANPGALPILVHLETAWGMPPDPIRRLAALGGDAVAGALRLSRAEARRLSALRVAAESDASPAELGYRLGADGPDAVLLHAALVKRPPPPEARAQVGAGAAACFPVLAQDLMPALSGPALGQRLKELEARWIASGFVLTREELLR